MMRLEREYARDTHGERERWRIKIEIANSNRKRIAYFFFDHGFRRFQFVRGDVIDVRQRDFVGRVGILEKSGGFRRAELERHCFFRMFRNRAANSFFRSPRVTLIDTKSAFWK
jgi:hypothetical protein